MPARIVTSPLARARESAGAFLAGLRASPPWEIDRALAPDEPPAGVLDALRLGAWGEGPLILIGHQPLLGTLVEALTGAHPPLSPGALARVELPRAGAGAGGPGVLALHLPPLPSHL
jgi:phosphohistidine phosphatase SixA